jgi:hypothetical protein
MTSSKISRMPCFAADLAQALEIALRRDEDAGRAGHRLDDDRRDGRGSCSATMRSSSSARCAPQAGWPLREGHAWRVVGVGQVVDAIHHHGANILRFAEMPPTEMPPKPTP